MRLDFEHAVHHVTNRGNDQRDIFRDDGDRIRFLDLFAETVIRYKWIVYSWTLMDNHFHLVVETVEPTLSRGMHWLLTEYVKYFNRKYKRHGHLFQGRFHSVLVDSEAYLKNLTRYVATNAVRAGLARSIEQWEWSSFFSTAGMPTRAPAVLSNGTAKILAQFHATDMDEARRLYLEFMRVAVDQIEDPWKNLRNRIYLGDEEWIEQIQRKIDEKPRSSDHAKAERHLFRPTMKQVVEAVAQTFRTGPDAVRRGHGGRARMLVAHLAVYEGVHLRRTIATTLRLKSASRVSALLRECREAIRSDDEFRAVVKQARELLDHRPPAGAYQLQRPVRDLTRESTDSAFTRT